MPMLIDVRGFGRCEAFIFDPRRVLAKDLISVTAIKIRLMMAPISLVL